MRFTGVITDRSQSCQNRNRNYTGKTAGKVTTQTYVDEDKCHDTDA